MHTRMRPSGCRTGIILVLAGIGAQPAIAAEPNAPPAVVEKVVVTASERSEVRKSPQSVAAIQGVQLARLGALNLRDYIDTIPGLNATDTGNGGVHYNIRGVSGTSAVNNDVATVAYYLDDTPISESQTGADIVPFDLQRIDVLRGPQGTQFGEASLAGAIRVVTNKPDATRLAGAVETSASETAHGGANQSVSAMLNLPLIKDQLAVRAALSEYRDSGYLDNIVTHQNDINSQRKDEARLAARWTPDARLTVDISGLAAYEHEGGRNQDFALAGPEVLNVEGLAETFGLGRLQPTALIPNLAPPYSSVSQFPENFTTRRQVLNGTVSYDFGWAQLLSSTSYYRLAHQEFFDSRQDGQVVENALSFFHITAPDGGPLNLVSGTPSTLTSSTQQATQEVRLTSASEQRLRWDVGAFYQYRQNGFGFVQSLPDLAPLLIDELHLGTANNFVAHQTVTFNDYALFGQATYDLTRRLHLTGGTRLFIEDENGSGQTDILNTFDFSKQLLSPLTFPAIGVQHQKRALFRASLGYDITPDLSGYLLFSEGARPGGLNQRLLTSYLPQSFRGDSTRNYEVGLKGAFLDRRLTASAALYQIDWSNTQIYVAALPGGQNTYNLPAGARVRGLEMETAYALTPNLALGGSYGWECGLTRGPLTYFNSLTYSTILAQLPTGTELPDTPHNKISLYAEYGRSWDATRLSMRVSDQYVGSSVPAVGLGFRLQPFNRLNAQLRLERGNYALTLYADNLLDRIIEVASPSPLPGSFGIGIDRPRTVGLRLDGAF